MEIVRVTQLSQLVLDHAPGHAEDVPAVGDKIVLARAILFERLVAGMELEAIDLKDQPVSGQDDVDEVRPAG